MLTFNKHFKLVFVLICIYTSNDADVCGIIIGLALIVV